MIKEYLFPTIIYIKDLPNPNELNSYLENILLSGVKMIQVLKKLMLMVGTHRQT